MRVLIHRMFYLFGPIVILMIVTAISALILRGMQIPQCYYCGAAKVRPSRPIGLLDFAGTILLIKTYRCGGCRTRFHAFRLWSRSTA